MSSSKSVVARQQGNEFFRSAAAGVAPVIRIDRYQKALTYYHKALDSAENDEELSSAYKNLTVTTQYITTLNLEQNIVDQCLFYFKECVSYGEMAISTGRSTKSEEWLGDIVGRIESVFSDVFDFILSLKQQQRIKILHRFCSVPESKNQRAKILKQLVKDYFHISVVALEENDHKESLRALTELYTPLTKLEELVCNISDDDTSLKDFIDNMKEDVFKNRCISESLQKRLIADKLLETSIYEAEDLDMNAIWQVIDFYTESIVLTRENDVEQEAISLTKIGILYHKVLMQKNKAKEVLMKVLLLAQSLQPRNLSGEKWFRDASSIISEYQKEQKQKEEKEWEESRKKHLDNLKPKLKTLKENMDKLSIQKILVWLYTDHAPTHGVKKFEVDIAQISKAPGDALKKLLAKAIVYYHPDKIDTEVHGVEYKVWCEEIVKYLTSKYEMMKGV